ncbi:MAG: hypothetical protein JNL88_09135 [Bacteroidia bacterium]|nr:hypothetical protein [Bacteroidia bacterium]
MKVIGRVLKILKQPAGLPDLIQPGFISGHFPSLGYLSKNQIRSQEENLDHRCPFETVVDTSSKRDRDYIFYASVGRPAALTDENPNMHLKYLLSMFNYFILARIRPNNSAC